MKYILAPHVDDEVIGCYTELAAGNIDEVVYFAELSDERKTEAKNSASYFNFKYNFNGLKLDYGMFKKGDTVYVPTSFDAHQDHKFLSLVAKQQLYGTGVILKYYSVDLVEHNEVLTDEQSKGKRLALLSLFPSQIGLFNSNEKYHLFESIRDSDTKKMIWVTFQKKGIHWYNEAKSHSSLKDVSYLGNPHRHLFKFKVSIEVFHNNRDIEFHQFLNWLESLYDNSTLLLDGKSCEMISDDLAHNISLKYPGRKLTIEVSEDGECGSTIEYNI